MSRRAAQDAPEPRSVPSTAKNGQASRWTARGAGLGAAERWSLRGRQVRARLLGLLHHAQMRARPGRLRRRGSLDSSRRSRRPAWHFAH